jgi:lysophospholipase L1-like esterase
MLNRPKIFSMDGINDITQGMAQQQTFKNIAAVVTKIKTKSPDTKIYIHSILPVSSAEIFAKAKLYNQWIKKYAEQNQVTYIDLFPLFVDKDAIKKDLTVDGTHLTTQGYLLWKEKSLLLSTDFCYAVNSYQV